MTKKRSILVIDDSAVMLARIKHALVAADYEVIATTQIVGNARHLRNCDLVILDYHMPGLNGTAVVESMRTLAHATKNACAFFLYTSDEKAASAYKELGFDGVFTSKGNEDMLVRQVGSFFRLVDMRAARERLG